MGDIWVDSGGAAVKISANDLIANIAEYIPESVHE
jgi:hypothetical protein